MKLSHEEEAFLRQWMYDEVHYQEGPGPAKRLQLQHGAVPADLATLIAAAIPDPEQQHAAGFGPTTTAPVKWPWSSKDSLRERVDEAESILAEAR